MSPDIVKSNDVKSNDKNDKKEHKTTVNGQKMERDSRDELYSSLPRGGLIARFGVGHDGIDKEKATSKGKNQLLYLMEAGLMLFQAEKYKKAIKVFSKADHLADTLYARSISGTGLSLLINDRSQDYRGEDFERIMINTYLGRSHQK